MSNEHIEDETVVDSADTATTEDLEVNDTSDDSNQEDEAAEDSESQKQQSGETPDQKITRLKRQLNRELKKQGQESGEESSEEGDKKEVSKEERYTRLELKTEGVTSKKAQDVVLQYMKEASLIGKEVDVSTALKSMVVKEAIAEIAKKTSAPAPSNRTSAGASDTFAYWKAQALKGNFPRHDKEMMAKLKKARIFTS